MTPGERLADAIPDSVYEYVHEHPKVIYAVTVPLVAWSVYSLIRAIRLHTAAEMFVRNRAADAARAASEALGG